MPFALPWYSKLNCQRRFPFCFVYLPKGHTNCTMRGLATGTSTWVIVAIMDVVWTSRRLYWYGPGWVKLVIFQKTSRRPMIQGSHEKIVTKKKRRTLGSCARNLNDCKIFVRGGLLLVLLPFNPISNLGLREKGWLAIRIKLHYASYKLHVGVWNADLRWDEPQHCSEWASW